MATGDGEERTPRITLGLLTQADTMCARRMRAEHHDQRSNRPATMRHRVANRIMRDARRAHTELARPEARWFGGDDDLEPEELHSYQRAARTYVDVYEHRAVRVVELDEWETMLPDIGARLVGPAPLAVVDASGAREVRILHTALPNRSRPSPVESPGEWFARLRLGGWADGDEIRLCHTDLWTGEHHERVVPGDKVDTPARRWLADRFAVIHARARSNAATPGVGCGTCRFVAGCPAHG